MSVYVYIFFVRLGLIEKFIFVLYIPRVLLLRVTVRLLSAVETYGRDSLGSFVLFFNIYLFFFFIKHFYVVRVFQSSKGKRICRRK